MTCTFTPRFAAAQAWLDQNTGAASADLEAGSDLHATADYRRRVAVTLGTRALEDAFADARSGNGALQ